MLSMLVTFEFLLRLKKAPVFHPASIATRRSIDKYFVFLKTRSILTKLGKYFLNYNNLPSCRLSKKTWFFA